MSKVSLRMQWGETHVRHGNAKNRMHINSIIALNLFLNFAISSGKKTSERKQAIGLKYFGIVFSIPYEQIALVCLRCDYHCNNSFRCLVKISRKIMYFKIFLFIQRSTKSSTMPKHKWSLNGSTAKPTTCSNTIGTEKNIIYGKYCAG